MKLKSEDWLFSRLFSYVDGQMNSCLHQRNIFKNKYLHEPKSKMEIPYLIVDDYGLLINQNNETGKWMKWDWEDTKSIRIYSLMHPWNASIFQWQNDCDYYREKRKVKRYMRYMKHKYKKFDYSYEEKWGNEFSIILEGKNKNGQFWLPSKWIYEGDVSWFMETIEQNSLKTVKFFNTDEKWNEILNTKNEHNI